MIRFISVLTFHISITFMLFSIYTSDSMAYGQPEPQPVSAKHGMVASAEFHASQVGVDILKRGGNAVDAAVAVGLALAVTYPAAGNLGGGGFMLIRLANGESVVIDYRETAPKLASRDMYLDSSGNVIPDASLLGSKAAGIPGTVAGLAMAHAKYGKLPWKDLVEPARLLAERGFPVSFSLANSLRNSKEFKVSGESRRIFQREGKFYEPGELLRQPELASTLRRLQTQGSREFYEGDTARLIAREASEGHGLLSLSDLKNYKPTLRQTLHGTYRGMEVVTMPPPSSGGIALIQMLNMLEGAPLHEMGYNSSASNHLIIETMKRAFADRAEFLGDTDFVTVPVKGLMSKNYAKRLAETIDPKRAIPSSDIHAGKPKAHESEQTTHFSIVDSEGNAVSNTYTLYGSFGCGVTVRGAGFLLNNEMDDFASKPGVPNAYGLVQGEANAIQPGKRPLSSMTPTMLIKNGKLYLIIGSPGGPTIISTVLQVILNVVDFDMNLLEAISAPRLHHQWLPDVVKHEPYRLSKDVEAVLKRLGHDLGDAKAVKSYWGDAEGIMLDAKSGLYLGASDPRSHDSRAIGY